MLLCVYLLILRLGQLARLVRFSAAFFFRTTAGIDGLNPLEPRAHMDIAVLRRQYPSLILAGGMDNSDTLLHGPADRVRTEARAIIDMGCDGGVIIGTHSISPEIPFELYQAYHETCRTYGVFGNGA